MQMGVRPGHEWERWAAADLPASELEAFISRAPFFREGRRRHFAATISVPETLLTPPHGGNSISTQMGFGQILNEIAREQSLLSERIVTTAPDVTVSTNLGPWVNRRGLFRARA